MIEKGITTTVIVIVVAFVIVTATAVGFYYFFKGGAPEPFDFSISVTPSESAVIRGNSVTYLITVTLLQGEAKPVTLFAPKSDEQLTFILNPIRGTPPFTSVLTVSTSNATDLGRWWFTIKGEAEGLAHISNKIYLEVREEVDNIAPNIANVTIYNLTPTSFAIFWITDEPATTQIRYKSLDETSYHYSEENKTLTLQHTYTLTNLTAHTYYYVTPISSDEKGNNATGNEVRVTTPGKPLPFKVTAPELESINLSPTPYFEWTKSKYADKYVLEVATTPQFGNTTVYRKEFNASITEHRVENTLKSLTKYYYRIVAMNEWGNVTATNTPSWFTTCLLLGKKVGSLAISPDNTKAVVIYSLPDWKDFSVISLKDPPHIIANFTLPYATVDVAITYDSKYAVITVDAFGKAGGYILDLNTLTLNEIIYDNPDINPLGGYVITAPNRDTAYIVPEGLFPLHGNDYIDYIVSVLDVPSGRIVDYVHVYERATVTSDPVDLYAISKSGTYLYVGHFTGITWNNTICGFVEKLNLQAKIIEWRRAFAGISSGPWYMQLTPDETYGLVVVQKGVSDYIWWWNINTNKIDAQLEYTIMSHSYKSMAITPDGNKLVVRGIDKVGVISVPDHKVIEEHYCYRYLGYGVVVSSDGKFALFGGDGRLGILFLD